MYQLHFFCRLGNQLALIIYNNKNHEQCRQIFHVINFRALLASKYSVIYNIFTTLNRPILEFNEKTFKINEIYRFIEYILKRSIKELTLRKQPNGFFVCLEVFVPLENFSHIWGRHHCQWRAANFDLCTALMATAQWGFFRVSQLLWHGASVYYGHLAVEMSLLNFPLAGQTLQPIAPPLRQNVFDLLKKSLYST